MGAILAPKIITKEKLIVRIATIMDKVKRIQELRRSNAATAITNKKKYNRKEKYKKRFDK